jgi:hypothetical protein
MHPLILVAAASSVPFVCLGLLMWLAWLEDTLAADVKKSERRHAPRPVRAVAVQPADSGPAAPDRSAPDRSVPDRSAPERPVSPTAAPDVARSSGSMAASA